MARARAKLSFSGALVPSALFPLGNAKDSFAPGKMLMDESGSGLDSPRSSLCAFVSSRLRPDSRFRLYGFTGRAASAVFYFSSHSIELDRSRYFIANYIEFNPKSDWKLRQSYIYLKIIGSTFYLQGEHEIRPAEHGS